MNAHMQVVQQILTKNVPHNPNFQKNKSSEVIKTYKGQIVPLDRLQNQDLLDKS